MCDNIGLFHSINFYSVYCKIINQISNVEKLSHVNEIWYGGAQGWQVCDEAVITAGKNTVITGSSQTTRVVTNCRKPSQTQK